MISNLGKLDRIFRFVLAIWWLSPLAPQFDANWGNIIIAVIGWVALIESFWGYCWLHSFFKVDNKHQ